jgi:hypothetical protein
MGKDIKTKAAQEVKTLESAGEPGKRMKQAYIREKQRKVGDISGTSPPPLGEERASDQPGAVHSEQPEYAPSAKGKTLKIPSPGEQMKAAFLQAKKAAVSEQSVKQDQQEDPSAQAAQQVGETGKRTADSALHRMEQMGCESLFQVNPRMEQTQESFQELKDTVKNSRQEGQRPLARASLPHKEGERAAYSSLRQVKDQTNQHSQKMSSITRKRRMASIKTPAKGNVKTAAHFIKTAEWSSDAGIKTSQQVAAKTKAAAKAAKQSARRMQGARAKAQVAARMAKQAAHVTAKTIKAAIAAAKALVTALFAGGWVVVMVVVVICLIGLLVGSCFGIFFSGEDIGTSQTIRTAIAHVNQEYQERLEEIQTSYTYDTLEITGNQAVWKEVLAVYAVKTTTDPQGQDVASMDEEKLGLLTEVFWKMNQISARVETCAETTQGEDGETVETEVIVLVITVSSKTAQDMEEQLGFDTDQKEQLQELLSPEYNDLWNELLYGVALGGGNGDLVAIAQSQVGNVGGVPYWSWYGFSGRVEWCAIFVSWCAGQCGLLDSGAVPKFAGVGTGVNWFQSRGQWLPGSATPEPGMLIFFQWYGSDSLIADHVGIVERVENGQVYTIEGNSNNMVRRKSYPLGYGEIKGYGIPLD